MRLVDLHPEWLAAHDASGRRRERSGIEFDCPHCAVSGAPERLHVLFTNPIDGDGSPLTGHNRTWARTGDSFETLPLSPSLDCSGWGHWHGFVRGGAVTSV